MEAFAVNAQIGVVQLSTEGNRTQVDEKAFELLAQWENTTLRLKGEGFTWNFASEDMVDLYYQPEDGPAEWVTQLPVSEEGIVAIPLEHCSVYFLTVTSDSGSAEDIQNTPITDVETAVETTTTSSFSWTAAGLIGLVLIALVVIVVFVVQPNQDDDI